MTSDDGSGSGTPDAPRRRSSRADRRASFNTVAWSSLSLSLTTTPSTLRPQPGDSQPEQQSRGRPARPDRADHVRWARAARPPAPAPPARARPRPIRWRRQATSHPREARTAGGRGARAATGAAATVRAFDAGEVQRARPSRAAARAGLGRGRHRLVDQRERASQPLLARVERRGQAAVGAEGAEGQDRPLAAPLGVRGGSTRACAPCCRPSRRRRRRLVLQPDGAAVALEPGQRRTGVGPSASATCGSSGAAPGSARCSGARSPVAAPRPAGRARAHVLVREAAPGPAARAPRRSGPTRDSAARSVSAVWKWRLPQCGRPS